jgi:4-hydroxybenzoate polyprenyltransferase
VAGRSLSAGIGAAAHPGPPPLAVRFWAYQKERFPLARYAPLVAVFTFSAAAYSRLLRNEPGFIRPELLAAGVATALVFFFILRVLDEHKDAEVDRRFRPELPVPRGLIGLPELRRIGLIALAGVLALNLVLAPVMLLALLAVALWTALMTREFFAARWLRAHPTAYLASHMLVMPLIDGYSTGLDWLAAGGEAPPGLWFFLALTFLNGTLLEVGRKIRCPVDEREGVDTYTRAWGLRAAPAVWLAVLAAAALTTWLAARQTGGGAAVAALVAAAAALCALPALRFRRTCTTAWAKRLDAAGGLWTLATYLLLGAGPFVARWLGG